MTTTSMHKPGWRSRRRSRLSLVERAVPRLGLSSAPRDGTKPPTVPPSQAKPRGNTIAGAVAFASDHDVGQTHARTAASDDQNVEQTAAPLSEQLSDETPPQPGDVHDPALEANEPSVALLEADGSSIEGQGDISNADVMAPSDDGPAHLPADQPALASIDSQGSPAASQEAERPVQIETSTDASLSSVPDTDADEAATPSVQPPQRSSSDPVFELDWDMLIENGFLDPRDRGRSLAPDMKEIVRVLIRQALSDQASWRDRVILVTSPSGRTSKSTAAISFALGLTTVDNHRTVLVDVDTMGPGAVDRLGCSGRTGISEALADPAIEIGNLEVRTDLDRLTLVPSGPPEGDILDRFASHRMLAILRFLTENPDTLLIIDAPPILDSQEAAVLSVVAGQVVMTVEAGRTTADQIEHALQRIGERHNVSLVLVEPSDDADETSPKAASFGGDLLSENDRRAAVAKRRPARIAAAIAGMVTIGLIMSMPADGKTSLHEETSQARDVATMATVPPERWPLDSLASGSLPLRMIRRDMGQ